MSLLALHPTALCVKKGLEKRTHSERDVRSLKSGCLSKSFSSKRTSVGRIYSVSAESATATETVWFQKQIKLPPVSRGCHVITHQLVSGLKEIGDIQIGLVNFFILHTSASLTINENASPDVPLDLNDSLNRIVPEGRFYRHDDEGPDDMPAHVKSSLMGPSLTIPITRGRLALGIWQGIYLNEHRDYGGSRNIIATIQGQRKNK